MSNWITLVIGLISGLGIGSGVTSLIQYFLNKKQISLESQRKDLEARYRVIILLMYAVIDFKRNKTSLHKHRPDLKSVNAILDELKAECHNMLLFASEETIKNLHIFIKNPNNLNFQKTAIFMRKDLKRGNIKCDETLFKFEV